MESKKSQLEKITTFGCSEHAFCKQNFLHLCSYHIKTYQDYLQEKINFMPFNPMQENEECDNPRQKQLWSEHVFENWLLHSYSATLLGLTKILYRKNVIEINWCEMINSKLSSVKKTNSDKEIKLLGKRKALICRSSWIF